MKKKLSVILLILMLISCFALTGCKDEEEEVEYHTHAYSEYDLTTYVTLPDYASYSYTFPEVSVTDEEVQERITETLEENVVTNSVTTGEVYEGDTIVISFDGVLADGTTVDGMSSESYEMTLGTTSMIDGFTESIYGHSVGDTFDADLTFPDPYSNNTDLSGKDVTFTISILSKQVEEVPEYTLDWVTENTDYDTLEDYEESVKETLLSEKEEEEANDIKQDIYQRLLEESTVSEVIAEKVTYEMDLADRWLHALATSYGMEWDEFLNAYYGIEEADYETTMEEEANDMVKSDMIVYALANEMEIKLPQADLDYFTSALLESAGLESDTFTETYGVSPEEYIHYFGYDYMLYINEIVESIYATAVTE